MEAFLKKYWPMVTLVLGALSPVILPPIQTFVNAHPEIATAVAWVVAHFLPVPVPQTPAPPK